MSTVLSERARPSRTPAPITPAPITPAPLGLAPRSTVPDPRRWRDGPTPASVADLLALTAAVAAEVADGRHEVVVDPAHRWSRRLHADDHLDVWLITWAGDQSAELHDHGGSLGALSVVSGVLTEWRWSAGVDDLGCAEELATRGPGLRRREVAAGAGLGFGLGHVHDVANRAVAPAVSVHAYSPPLSAMSYYDVDAGVLRRRRSELIAPGQSPE